MLLEHNKFSKSLRDHNSETIDQRSHSDKDKKKDRLCIVIALTTSRVNSLTQCLHKSKWMMVIALNNLAKSQKSENTKTKEQGLHSDKDTKKKHTYSTTH